MLMFLVGSSWCHWCATFLQCIRISSEKLHGDEVHHFLSTGCVACEYVVCRNTRLHPVLFNELIERHAVSVFIMYLRHVACCGHGVHLVSVSLSPKVQQPGFGMSHRQLLLVTCSKQTYYQHTSRKTENDCQLASFSRVFQWLVLSARQLLAAMQT